MDPPSTNSRARKLYSRILVELEAANAAEGPEREAVLLGVSDLVGELAEIAEGAAVAAEASDNEGPTRGEVLFLLSRISLELLRILSGAGVYSGYRRDEEHGTRRRPVFGSRDQVDSRGLWPIAA